MRISESLFNSFARTFVEKKCFKFVRFFKEFRSPKIVQQCWLLNKIYTVVSGTSVLNLQIGLFDTVGLKVNPGITDRLDQRSAYLSTIAQFNNLFYKVRWKVGLCLRKVSLTFISNTFQLCFKKQKNVVQNVDNKMSRLDRDDIL